MAEPGAEPSRHISASAVRTGARLLRGASQAFTGGADGLHHSHSTNAIETSLEAPTEATPLATAEARPQSRPVRPQLVQQASTRELRQTMTPNQVMERLQHEAMDAFTRNMKWLVLVAIVCTILLITGMIVFVYAFVALMYHHDKPCDQPLKYYLIVNVLWSQVPGNMQKVLVGDSWSWQTRLGLALVMVIPGWCIIGWGFYMVHNVETCPKTNPGLYYPTQQLIFFNIGFAVLGLIITLVLALGARRLTLYVTTLMEGPGCAEAVHTLPKVAGDAQELIAEDGDVKGCPICLESLANDGAVKTPCDHYFHEECLSTWCATHLDCPLCRQLVGEPDTDKKPEGP